MADKQIIIDGIKISKEDFIDKFSIELTNRNIFEREQIGDKYFEIILAKEKECEELNKWLPIVTRLEVAFGSIETEKAKAIDYNTYAGEFFRKLDQLEKENKELRQLLSKEPLALQALQRAYSSYKKSTDEFYKMAKDYKQALTEIKEIAKHFIEKGLEPQSVEHQLKLRGKEELAKIILQKCEVLDV